MHYISNIRILVREHINSCASDQPLAPAEVVFAYTSSSLRLQTIVRHPSAGYRINNKKGLPITAVDAS